MKLELSKSVETEDNTSSSNRKAVVRVAGAIDAFEVGLAID